MKRERQASKKDTLNEREEKKLDKTKERKKRKMGERRRVEEQVRQAARMKEKWASETGRCRFDRVIFRRRSNGLQWVRTILIPNIIFYVQISACVLRSCGK